MSQPRESKSTNSFEDKIQVLVVDDDNCTLEATKMCLESLAPFKIETARSAKEGRVKISRMRFDVIISDYEMPEMNGLQFLEELRKHSVKIPFVLFTGKGREEIAIKALNLGAEGYFNKQGSPETVYGELIHGIISISNRYKTEQELDRNQHFLSQILNSSPNLVYIYDLESGSNVYANREVFDFLGYSPEQIKEMGSELFEKILHPEDFEVVSKHHLRCSKAKSEELLEVEYRMKHAKGDWRWLSSRDVPFLFNLDGTVKQILGSAEDITERKKEKEELAASEAKYRALVENADDTIMLSDLSGKHIYRNAAFFKNLGFEKGEEDKADGFVKIHPDDLPFIQTTLSELFKKGLVTAEYRVLHRNGSWVHRSSKSTIVYNSKNQPYAILTICRDITNSKNMELCLKNSEEKFFHLAKYAPAAIYEIDCKSLQFKNVNDYMCAMTGYSEQELLSMNPISLLDEESKERFLEIMKKSAAGEKIDDSVEFGINTKDGRKLWAALAAKLTYSNNELESAFVVAHDVTKSKQAEEELKKSLANERFLADLVRNVSIAIAIALPDGRLKLSNNAFQELTGYNEEELKTITWNTVLTPPEWRDYEAKKLEEINQSKKSGIYRKEYIRKDGSRGPIEITVHPFFDNSGNVIYYFSFVVDVSKRKEFEQEIAFQKSRALENQQKFKSLFRANPEATLFVDNDFRIVEANSSFTDLFGYSLAEIEGKFSRDVVVPDDRNEEIQLIREKLRQGLKDKVSMRKRKNGTEIPVSISGSPVLVDDKPVGFVIVYKDLSDIMTVQAELSKALSKAEALNEKLSVVGGFTRHDVRNKLSAIDTFVYLVKNIEENSKVIQILEQIETASNNAVQILEDAKTFEMLGSEKLITVDVGKIFEKAFSLFSQASNIQKINHCLGVNVIADSLLETVFYNLIDNSLKYGGKLTQIRISASEKKDGATSIIYEDDGVGIDENGKRHLFEKGSGKGTGLGLYLVRRTCETYNWTIMENGEFGKGVRFEFQIPSSKNEAVDG